MSDYKAAIADAAGQPFPQDPYDQLDEAVLAVFRSWDGDRARLYRRQEAIPDDFGTAVNVMADGVRQPWRRQWTGCRVHA